MIEASHEIGGTLKEESVSKSSWRRLVNNQFSGLIRLHIFYTASSTSSSPPSRPLPSPTLSIAEK